MQFAELSSAFTGHTVTHGWDAVCAMNAARTSQIFFQQYLNEGPTNPRAPLQAIFPHGTGSGFVLLDLILGPPQISFPADLALQQGEVQMSLVKGMLVQFDPDQQIIQSAIVIQPNESWIAGPVALDKVAGQVNTVGQVVANLAAGAYQPQIAGIEASSLLATEIGTAIQTFFAQQAMQYILGTIVVGNIPAALQPTHFEIVTQPDPNDTKGGCVLLLIQTNGTAGSVGPLQTYPIPEGHTAALLVSNQVLFNQLIPPFLTQEFKNMGTTFTGSQSNGVYSAVSSGGTVNLGQFSSDSDTEYSSDAYGSPAAVTIDTSGFVVFCAFESNLAVQWKKTFEQYWTTVDPIPPVSQTPYKANMACVYAMVNTASVDATTDVIAFSGSGSSQFGPAEHYSFWQKFCGHFNVPAVAEQRMNQTFDAIFGKLELPSVNTFALGNLLFPSLHALSLTAASVPCDLLASGDVSPRLQVLPATVHLQPGHTQQFVAVDQHGQPLTGILWELKPGLGSINGSGWYTAPAHVNGAEVVVVQAINCQNTTQSAGAMTVIYESPAANGLTISPPQLLLTAGQNFALHVTDASGNSVDATCSASPKVGTLTQGWTTGAWSYAAPATIDGDAVVTITAQATQDPTKTGTMKIYLAPTVPVTISPSASTVRPGGTVHLTASASGFSSFQWQLYPLGSGSIQADPSDSSKAIFTAPASEPQNQNVIMIVAYGLHSAAGIGLARVTFNP